MELVVSLVVGGVVVTAAQQAVVLATDARDRAEAARMEVARTTGGRELLSTWLRAATLRPTGLPFREDHEESWNSESVGFLVAHGGVLYPGSRRIRLWIERGPRGSRGLMAAVSRRRGEVGPPDTLLIEPMAERLNVRYWGAVDGAERWVEEWPTPDRLPLVVELELGTTPRIRIGPNGGTSRDLPPLMRLPIRISPAAASW